MIQHQMHLLSCQPRVYYCYCCHSARSFVCYNNSNQILDSGDVTTFIVAGCSSSMDRP